MEVAARLVDAIYPSRPQGKVAAVFKSFSGELDTQPSIKALWQLGVTTVLPVVDPERSGHLLFLPYHTHSPMTINRYGIEEPKLERSAAVPLTDIDWLFMPLVGFDDSGNRLGMGGGYYDRTLAQWRNGEVSQLTPIGLAFDEQRLANIPTEDWDVAIPQVITPSKHWHFS